MVGLDGFNRVVECVRRQLSAVARQSILELSAHHGAPLPVTVIAAVAALLQRYSETDDVQIGCALHPLDIGGQVTPAAGAAHDVVPLRVDLSGDPPFRDLVGRVARLHRAALAPGVPVPDRATSAGNLSTILQIDDSVGTPVTFAVYDGADGLILEAKYDRDPFGPYVGGRVLGHLCTLLTAAAAAPDACVSTLPILEPAERKTLLDDWNNVPCAPSRYSSISRRYEAQAAATPDRLAVVCGDQRLTYDELNARANRLARHLRQLGVGSETRVGICLERSANIAQAILGTLKAGGTYVPLDPVYPRDRLMFMLRNAHVSAVISERDIAYELLAEGEDTTRVEIDDPVIARHSTDDLPETASPDDAAYIMYTSGSTGEPRGVVVTHGSLCYYVDAVSVPIELSASDVYLHTASFSFSSSARQLFVPLAHGATVVVATQNEIRDPVSLFALIKQREVTVIDLVPSYCRTATRALFELERPAREDLLDNRLRVVLSASEPLLSDLPRAWMQELQPRARFINMFGQTETTGIVACHPVLEGTPDLVQTVPAGRPIPGARIWVLDRHLQPVPIGIAGEIVIGGPAVARGYLDQPSLTADKFAADPFGSDPARRVYRTGDRGRFRPDGTLEVLGRMDDQVKVRGIRVELGEVEAALTQCPGVREAVVAARKGREGETRLVAYLVTDANKTTMSAVRAFAARKLPSSMIPSAFLAVSSIPRTPTGKVDRRALPSAETERARSTKFVEPSDSLERELRQIWEDLLGVRPVGIRDDFFELGGHSLLAIHLLQRVERLSGRKLAPDVLAQGATVERVAHLIRSSDPHPRRFLSRLGLSLRWTRH